jgi:hypothetical protein
MYVNICLQVTIPWIFDVLFYFASLFYLIDNFFLNYLWINMHYIVFVVVLYQTDIKANLLKSMQRPSISSQIDLWTHLMMTGIWSTSARTGMSFFEIEIRPGIKNVKVRVRIVREI